MNIVIVGYGEMLKSVVQGISKTEHNIAGVFRHDRVMLPDFKRIFYDILNPSDDLNFIRNLNLYEIKAKSVNSENFRKKVIELKTDLIIVCSWSEKFSIQTINTPKLACINVHPSLLPEYRGANPYLQVILHNEYQTGITFHLMDVNYDTGSILHQVKVPVLNSDTGYSLKLRCCKCVSGEIINLLNNFNEKLNNKKSQNEKLATYYNNITLKDMILDFEKENVHDIDRRIRALTPWAKCFISCNNEFFSFKKYKIIKTNSNTKPALIIDKNNTDLLISCKDGGLIKFSSLSITRPFGRFFTKFYIKWFIKKYTSVI